MTQPPAAGGDFAEGLDRSEEGLEPRPLSVAVTAAIALEGRPDVGWTRETKPCTMSCAPTLLTAQVLSLKMLTALGATTSGRLLQRPRPGALGCLCGRFR